MQSIFQMFKRSSAPIPSIATRMQDRTSDFQLISLRPFLNYDGSGKLDLEKPHVFPSEIVQVSKLPSESVFQKCAISCADDIVYTASKIQNNVEMKALGMDIRMKAALMEASRKWEAEKSKYIVFQDPMHKYHGKNSLILENTEAHDSEHALVISLTPNAPLHTL